MLKIFFNLGKSKMGPVLMALLLLMVEISKYIILSMSDYYVILMLFWGVGILLAIWILDFNLFHTKGGDYLPTLVMFILLTFLLYLMFIGKVLEYMEFIKWEVIKGGLPVMFMVILLEVLILEV